MRLPSRQRSGLPRFDAAMTPLIDVIFQLLIFFLAAADLGSAEALLKTPLPATGAIDRDAIYVPKDLEAIRIELSGELPTIELNGNEVAGFKELAERLEILGGVSAEIPVILDSKPEVPVKHIVRVFDMSLGAGLPKIHFAASAESGT